MRTGHVHPMERRTITTGKSMLDRIRLALESRPLKTRLKAHYQSWTSVYKVRLRNSRVLRLLRLACLVGHLLHKGLSNGFLKDSSKTLKCVDREELPRPSQSPCYFLSRFGASLHDRSRLVRVYHDHLARMSRRIGQALSQCLRNRSLSIKNS